MPGEPRPISAGLFLHQAGGKEPSPPEVIVVTAIVPYSMLIEQNLTCQSAWHSLPIKLIDQQHLLTPMMTASRKPGQARPCAATTSGLLFLAL